MPGFSQCQDYNFAAWQRPCDRHGLAVSLRHARDRPQAPPSGADAARARSLNNPGRNLRDLAPFFEATPASGPAFPIQVSISCLGASSGRRDGALHRLAKALDRLVPVTLASGFAVELALHHGLDADLP